MFGGSMKSLQDIKGIGVKANELLNKLGIYTIDDLLWHQEDISEHLYNYGAGIVFEDPVCKGHMIYILFD